MPPTFLSVEVDPGPACEDGISLRFKLAGERRPVDAIRYESERGLDGIWEVYSAETPDGARSAAQAAQVDDSSDGVVWLIYGGRAGLTLVHRETGEIDRAPYLVLARLDADQ